MDDINIDVVFNLLSQGKAWFKKCEELANIADDVKRLAQYKSELESAINAIKADIPVKKEQLSRLTDNVELASIELQDIQVSINQHKSALDALHNEYGAFKSRLSGL